MKGLIFRGTLVPRKINHFITSSEGILTAKRGNIILLKTSHRGYNLVNIFHWYILKASLIDILSLNPSTDLFQPHCYGKNGENR